jgi:hypothetical protein
LDYAIHHDDNDVLDITFRVSGVGAYPDTSTTHIAIDLRTGERISAKAAFLPSRLTDLQTDIQSKALTAWKRAVAKHPDLLHDQSAPQVQVGDLDNFIVLGDRIVFVVDFALPHVIEAATPTSEFPILKPQLERYIRPDGPLGWLL